MCTLKGPSKYFWKSKIQIIWFESRKLSTNTAKTSTINAGRNYNKVASTWSSKAREQLQWSITKKNLKPWTIVKNQTLLKEQKPMIDTENKCSLHNIKYIDSKVEFFYNFRKMTDTERRKENNSGEARLQLKFKTIRN